MRRVPFGLSSYTPGSGGLGCKWPTRAHSHESQGRFWPGRSGSRTWAISATAPQDGLREGKFTALLRAEPAQLRNEGKGNILSCLLELKDCVISQLTLRTCENLILNKAFPNGLPDWILVTQAGCLEAQGGESVA